MNQQLNTTQTEAFSTSAPISAPTARQNAALSSEVMFSALSEPGQKFVADYLSRMGYGLPASERTETLRELHSHLLSLITAYQEIGDSESDAIQAAFAQFGEAQQVSAGLRWADSRNRLAYLLRKNDALLPAVLVPALFYNVSLLLSLFMTTTHTIIETGGGQTTHTAITAFGLPFLLLSFAAGVLNANLSKKWAMYGIFLGVACVVGAFTGLDTLFGGGNPASLNAMGASVVPWLGSACLGLFVALGTKAVTGKKTPA